MPDSEGLSVTREAAGWCCPNKSQDGSETHGLNIKVLKSIKKILIPFRKKIYR